MLSLRGMVAIGLISFPLYLWHWPALVWVRTYGPANPSAATVIAVLLCSVAAASATYLLVERPLRSVRVNLGHVSAAASASLVALGAAGAVVSATDGVPGRLPPEVQALVKKEPPPPSWRLGKCLLEEVPEDAGAMFGDCGGDQTPTVALLGDSHSGALYPALSLEAARAGYGVAEYASAGCSPWVNRMAAPKCAVLFKAAMERIRITRPEVVVLHAHWARYPKREPLLETITTLRAYGVRRIVVIGPVPTWPDRLNVLIGSHWQRHRSLPSDFMAEKSNGPAIESELRGIASRAGVPFVSAREPLCDTFGCLAIMRGGQPPVAYIDDNHLSESGAGVLAAAIWPQIIDSAPAP
jgi:hypothetical protein